MLIQCYYAFLCNVMEIIIKFRTYLLGIYYKYTVFLAAKWIFTLEFCKLFVSPPTLRLFWCDIYYLIFSFGLHGSYHPTPKPRDIKSRPLITKGRHVPAPPHPQCYACSFGSVDERRSKIKHHYSSVQPSTRQIDR